MTITPDAPSSARTIDGIPLTPKEVTTIGFEDLAPRATVEEERLHRKQKLAGALRIFGRFGFGEGVAGHITVRDPEFPDLFWVNPLGLSFRHMRVSDLILVDHNGDVVYGKHSVNRAAYVLHAAVHEARPDVVAAAHAHSVYGKAFSSLGIKLDFAKAFGMNRAAIHQNHGHFTVGSTIDEAVFWFVCFERCAQAQLAAMAAGTPKHIPHDSAVYTRENAGNAITGWMHFQPLWQEICRTDPDLFD
jgi:ribulose-5-phosphate 4-epimerase/fuculose-1-phosphate aldolase